MRPISESDITIWILGLAVVETGFHICVIGLRGLPNVVGGIETHCERVYSSLRSLDPSVRVTVYTRMTRLNAPTYRHSGLDIVVLPTIRGIGLDVPTYTVRALLAARLNARPDIVALHGIGPGFFAPLARLLGFKTIVTHHAEDFRRPKWGKLARMFLRAGEVSACATAHRVVCVSEALRDLLVKRYPFASKRVVAIRNGSEMPPQAGKNDIVLLDRLGLAPRRYILAVGRIEATKGFHELITAHARSTAAGLPLVIAGEALGDESYQKRLEADASQQVRFIGPQFAENLSALYRHAAVFVHPSHMEGYSLVVAEALAHGAPVILSDIPPHREFGFDEINYVPVGDINKLAARLSMDDYGALESRHAVELQRSNTWSITAARHLALFRRVMSPGEAPPARTRPNNDQ